MSKSPTNDNNKNFLKEAKNRTKGFTFSSALQPKSQKFYNKVLTDSIIGEGPKESFMNNDNQQFSKPIDTKAALSLAISPVDLTSNGNFNDSSGDELENMSPDFHRSPERNNRRRQQEASKDEKANTFINMISLQKGEKKKLNI